MEVIECGREASASIFGLILIAAFTGCLIIPTDDDDDDNDNRVVKRTVVSSLE